LLLAWMAGQGDTGEGGAVLVVPDVIADRIVLGAAALDRFDVNALIVRVGRDNLDLMCWGAAGRAVLAGQVQGTAAAGVDHDAVEYGPGDLVV